MWSTAQQAQDYWGSDSKHNCSPVLWWKCGFSGSEFFVVLVLPLSQVGESRGWQPHCAVAFKEPLTPPIWSSQTASRWSLTMTSLWPTRFPLWPITHSLPWSLSPGSMPGSSQCSQSLHSYCFFVLNYFISSECLPRLHISKATRRSISSINPLPSAAADWPVPHTPKWPRCLQSVP